MNRSGGATDRANNDLGDYADQSVAKKTGTPRSSINTQRVWLKEGTRETDTRCYRMQNNSIMKVINVFIPWAILIPTHFSSKKRLHRFN